MLDLPLDFEPPPLLDLPLPQADMVAARDCLGLRELTMHF